MLLGVKKGEKGRYACRPDSTSPRIRTALNRLKKKIVSFVSEIWNQTEIITYFSIDRGGSRYLIFKGARCVPNFLHRVDCLLDGHIPRVRGLTDKGDVRRDERIPEPFRRDKIWKLLVTSSFFGGCRVAGLPDWCRQLNVAESAALRARRRRVRG